MRHDDAGVELAPEQARAAALGMKGMISVGRPFLDYVISALADAGITAVCLVIGPEHGPIRHHYSSAGRPTRVQLHLAVQLAPRGTADAVAAARDFAGSSPFLSLNADNHYPAAAYRLLADLDGAGLIGFEPAALLAGSNIPPERLRRFALIAVDDNGYLKAIVEKPDDSTYGRLARQSLISMNLWALTPKIFEACARVTPSARGELEIQDAVRIASRELGERFRVIPFAGGVLDLATRGDVAAVTERLADVSVRL
jgi:glucose-1-phosphate thymidylyltransferase